MGKREVPKESPVDAGGQNPRIEAVLPIVECRWCRFTFSHDAQPSLRLLAERSSEDRRHSFLERRLIVRTASSNDFLGLGMPTSASCTIRRDMDFLLVRRTGVGLMHAGIISHALSIANLNVGTFLRIWFE